MAPKIIKQKKVLINTDVNDEQNTGSRLAAVPDIPLRVSVAKLSQPKMSWSFDIPL
jgi:hypothetical protein